MNDKFYTVILVANVVIGGLQLMAGNYGYAVVNLTAAALMVAITLYTRKG